ncbi:uncharacterized protein PV06_00749 [Exophiala oligosperma]|uniref:Uncharacterized protein n=1 Tax=Exophiala oligosperma TaxID=215243 RepID=A0A0D2E012_9EURO|nr:uncharacterized protein PV06_00749 [Exophiala oligosperma]KIW48130.1 hypothetical protein PV06_00749 [Exophiala oligosperma]
MDKSSRSNSRQVANKAAVAPKSHHHSPTTFTSSPVLGSDMRYYAYKLGTISKFKIEKEARKSEPRLHKLVGHCSLFDNARKYIIDTINHDDDDCEPDAATVDSGDEWSLDNDDKDDVSFEYVEDVQKSQPKSRSSKSSTHSHSTPRNGVVVVKAEEVLFDGIDEDDVELEWEYNSDSTVEDDDDEEDNWSDSTCEEDDSHVDSSSSYSDRKGIDILPTAQPKYTTQDDFLLWSQQPQVMTPSQANSLLIEAFA